MAYGPTVLFSWGHFPSLIVTTAATQDMSCKGKQQLTSQKMASKARAAFDKNAKDIERLLALHESEGGSTAGRRHGLEVLNKSAIVLITAFWEAYCEDIASEALRHIVKHAKGADRLPVELQKIVAKSLKSEQHDLAIWKLADGGWRKHLLDRFDAMTTERNKKLNTPKTQQIETLFRDAVGIEKVSGAWRWPKMTVDQATKKLDKMVSLRGAIAHRGSNSASVTKSQVTDYFKFIKKITAKTGGAINTHVKSATGEPLWPPKNSAR